MQNFTFHNPTRILFGKGREDKVGAVAREYGSRALVHFGGDYLRKNGLLERIEASLSAAGIEFVEYDGVVPNPRLSTVKEGIRLCRENQLDFVLAIGGGSAIDSSKAIAAGACMDGDVWDCFTGKAQVQKALPIGVVLTIPASGSESSKACIITKDEGSQKRMCSSPHILPKFAILDPETTYTLPAYQTAAGCCDIMSHLMERYFTQTEHVDFTDRLLEGALRTMLVTAPRVLAEPDNYDYRAEVMFVGNVAHNDLLGMGREEDWACHDIEHELSALYDVTHGAGLTVITPAWMKYVYKQNLPRFVQFAVRVMDVDLAFDQPEAIALEGIRRLEAFFRSLGMPTSFADLKIPADRIPEMAQRALDGRPYAGHFAHLKEEDIAAIYRLAL